MRYTLREFILYTFIVVGVFLVLTHATGFATGVKALGGTYVGGVKALQGLA